jgi:GrpB-like predicted nucleotidyltransferase (UPF0157 family)
MASSSESVLIGGIEKRELVIAEYDPAWPSRYEAHARALAAVLGETLVRIEHVGSTSVPGLAAKAIIDILVVVPNSADESSYIPPFASLGYSLRVRDPKFFEHRMLRTAARNVHAHVFSPGAPEIARMLTFRDHLRRSAEDRNRYEAVKRRLAVQEWPDMNSYADAKTDIIEGILRGLTSASPSAKTAT